jgi:hypothetical protein
LTLGAPAFDILLLILKLLHEAVGCIGPDLTERTLPHIAKAVVPPELISMDSAVPTDASDTATRVVPFIHLQEFKDLFGSFRVLFKEAHIEIRAIRVIVDREYLLSLASVMKVLGAVHDEVYHGPGFVVAQVLFDQLGTASSINQVVKTDPRNIQFFNEVKYSGNLPSIHFVNRKSEPNFYTRFLAVAYPVQGALKRPLHTPKPIVDFLQAVKAYAHIRKPDFFKDARLFRRDQGAVRGNDCTHAMIHSITGQFRQVLADKWFAAGKEDDRHAKLGKIVQKGLPFIRTEFILESFVFGVGITVDTFQVASPGDIPHNDRALISGELKKMGWELLRLTSVAQGV